MLPMRASENKILKTSPLNSFLLFDAFVNQQERKRNSDT
ncbi:hypothetical protein D046_5564 [Vibrio parahaemolyticus V-223/04]|nr:hypothetical protein D029_0082 [Vibrio parahaemolyticus 970107]EVU13891.1 hypothetical protein D046_5564 [Vibrio parahaemolyticus V-223/04]